MMKQRYIAHEGNDGGYISDVPTIASMNGSEISQDLVVQTKVLEKHFRDKYEVLRAAYEDRIKELSQVVQQTCANLVNDDLVQEMRSDKVSSIFIPAHVSEIIQKHLESEREHYIHTILQKSSTLESELKQSKILNIKLKDEMKILQNQLHENEIHFESEMKKLKGSLQQKVLECDQLRKRVNQQAYEVDVLEQSFQQSTRELAIIENLDQQSQRHRQDLQEQCLQMTKQRNQFHEENIELKTELTLLKEEHEHTLSRITQYQHEEEANKKRIETMMKEVEHLLDQEAKESNQAISTVHEKMKTFRTRLVSELTKERRMNTILQEELTKLKSLKAGQGIDQQASYEKENDWKERLFLEQQKNQQLQTTIQSLNTTTTEAKLTIHDLQIKNRSLLEKMEDIELQHKKEKHHLIEKIKMEVWREAELHFKRPEKSDSHLLQLENEVQNLTQTLLRHSLTMQAKDPVNTTNTSMISNNASQLENEINYQKIILNLQTEKEEILQKRREMESVVDASQQRVAELQILSRSCSEENIRLRELLKTATTNIEKLRTMVQEGKNAVLQQKSELAAAQVEARRYQLQIQEYENRAKERLLSARTISVQTIEEARPPTPPPPSPPLPQSPPPQPIVIPGIVLKENESIITNEERDAKEKLISSLQSQQQSLLEEKSRVEQKMQELQTANTTLTTIIANMTSSLVNNTSQLQQTTVQSTAPPAVFSVNESGGKPGGEAKMSWSGTGEDEFEDGWRSDILSHTSNRHSTTGYNIKALDRPRRNNPPIVDDLSAFDDEFSSSFNAAIVQPPPKPAVVMVDVGVNTIENLQLIEVSEQLQRIQLDQRLLQDKTGHRDAQLEALQNELQGERNRLLQSQAHCQKLYQIIHSVYALYLPQLHSLRHCLADLRGYYKAFELQLQTESRTTVQKFRLEFVRIFDGFKALQKQKISTLKVQLSSAHSKELTALEQRFIAQINSLNAKHSTELEKMHREVLVRAEKAVNGSLYGNDLSNSFRDNSINEGSLKAASEGVPFTLTATNNTNTSVIPAFESVLKGLLQGLRDEELFSPSTAAQVETLARTNREPSVAANATARAIVSEEADKFYLHYITKRQLAEGKENS